MQGGGRHTDLITFKRLCEVFGGPCWLRIKSLDEGVMKLFDDLLFGDFEEI